MYTDISIAIYAIYVLILMNIIFAIVIYGLKIRNMRYRKVYEQFNVKFKDYLTYIQTNIESDEPLRVPPVKMNQIESEALQDRLNDMIEAFTGEQRQKLIDLCEDLGFISYHMDRLKSSSYQKKIDAAYHLGCMRASSAVPALLEFLRSHRLNSSLFVIARAIAKSSSNKHEIKEMTQILLTHKKGFHDLIVDMIEESPLDHVELFNEWIHKGEPEFVHIGLTGLKEYNDPTVVSAVYRLMDSKNPAIQEKAIKVYLQSNQMLPKHVVGKLLEHTNADIRLLTIQAASELKNGVYADLLKKTLGDVDQRVIYASVKGLTHLGEEGMTALCEGAFAMREKAHGPYIQSLIEEEIKRLSAKLHDLDDLTRYNTLRYAYEKTFGNPKKIYRVV